MWKSKLHNGNNFQTCKVIMKTARGKIRNNLLNIIVYQANNTYLSGTQWIQVNVYITHGSWKVLFQVADIKI